MLPKFLLPDLTGQRHGPRHSHVGHDLYKIGDRHVDLVLTDQNMPRMDGLTLIRELRGVDRFKRTPILMLTTESSDEMKQAGRAAGATGWMVKPFDPQRLLEIISKVLPN